MKQEKIRLEPNGATLTTYIHSDNETRQAILIFPGGAYRYCSPGEGAPVAKAYYDAGFNAFVLEYSTSDGLFGSPKIENKEEIFDSALEDAMNAFYYIQDHEEEFSINKDTISIVGFSAGANLALGSVTIGNLKPLSLILGYGVYSDILVKALGLGPDDLIKRINKDIPPIFMFLCQADQTVPAKESLKLALACSENEVPFELHCYIAGDHGLSLGTKESGIVNKDYATWFDHSIQFLINIERDTPLALGDITDDLKDININSRIGALMYNEKAWELIEKLLPDIAFKAKTDSNIRSKPLQRMWRYGLVKEISEEEVDKMLREL